MSNCRKLNTLRSRLNVLILIFKQPGAPKQSTISGIVNGFIDRKYFTFEQNMAIETADMT